MSNTPARFYDGKVGKMAIVDGLKALDAIDELVRSAEKELAAGPGAVAAAEAQVQSLENVLAQIKDTGGAIARKMHSLEVDIKAREEDVRKTQEHQRQAKSNKEYQIFREKIEKDRSAIAKIEDEILALMEEQEKISAQASQMKKALADAAAKADETRKAVEKRAAEINAALGELAARRSSSAAAVDPEDMKLYERARRSARGTSALAPLRGAVCGACNVMLTPQTVNLVFIGKDIVTCVSCHRILYADDQTDTRTEKGDDT
ncbi:MAG TPA: hypothetical protein ENN09_05720 [Planctomycetes bacterium]|nr:hypothetical protein [Planctomycetota bacterium]